MSKMTKAQQAKYYEARGEMREDLYWVSTIYTTAEYASKNATTAHVKLYVPRNSGYGLYIQQITFRAAEAMGDKLSDRGGIKFGGYGYNKEFMAVYNLGRSLYPDGYYCTGNGDCHSNDHTNEWQRERSTDWHHSDGGYRFMQSSL